LVHLQTFIEKTFDSCVHEHSSKSGKVQVPFDTKGIQEKLMNQ